MPGRNTIQADPDEDDEVEGEIVGFTVEGGPIVRFTHPFSQPLPEHADLLGACENNRPLVAYKRDSIRFLSTTEAAHSDCGKVNFASKSTQR